MLSSVHFRRAVHRPMVLAGMLSRAPMASMMNRSFNSDRCYPFSSNNGPVLQRDWDADCIIASDVLCWKPAGNILFSPIHCDICGGQDHENLPQLVAFGIRPRAPDCSWPSRSVIPFNCEWMHFLSLSWTIAGFVLKSGMIYIHTDTVCGQFGSKL